MTQKISSNDRSRRSPLVTPRYMLGTAKRGWALVVLFFVAFLFTVTVVAMLILPQLRHSIDRAEYPSYYTRDSIIESVSSNAESLRSIFVAVSAIAAVFSGVHFLGFMHSKTSAGFYHSLPERRSGHFISAIFSSLAVYLTAAIPNYIFTLLIFAVYGFFFAELIPLFLSILLYGIFYFIVFLAVTMLAGVISGSRVIHTIMTGFLLFSMPVLYLAAMLMLNYGTSYLNVDSMMLDIETHKWLSPVFRAAYVLIEDSSFAVPAWILVLFDVIISAAMFALAYYAYTKRPIERSGTPIIYAPLAEVIKYIIIAPSAIFMYMFFDIFGDTWGMFGFLAGLVLTYMLCNTVLNRSAKAMFSHFKGMVIYSAALIVSVFVLAFGCFGIFDYAVPAASEMTLSLYDGSSSGTITLTERDDIESIRHAMKEFTGMLRENHIDYYNYSGYFYSDNFDDFEALAGSTRRCVSLYVNYKTPFGFVMRYSYISVPYEYLFSVVDAILENDSAMGCISPSVSSIINMSVNMQVSTSHLINDDTVLYDSSLTIDSLRDRLVNINATIREDKRIMSGDEFAKRVNSIFSAGKENRFQRHAIGSIYIFTDEYDSSYSSSLYFDDLIALSRELDSSYRYESDVYADSLYSYISASGIDLDSIFSLTEGEYFDGVAKTIDEIAVYSRTTGKTKYFRGDEVRDILPNLSDIDGQSTSPLTKTDNDYVVLVKVRDFYSRNSFYYYHEYYYVEASEIVDDEAFDYYSKDLSESYSYYVTWFLDGQVPDIAK